MFPPLWGTILLAPLKISRKMMLDYGHCFKNASWPIAPLSVEID
jgi:hypothetical protein